MLQNAFGARDGEALLVQQIFDPEDRVDFFFW